MTTLRGVSRLSGIAVAAVIGLLLVFEATDVVDGSWRSSLADWVGDLASPDWPLWVSALLGAALAVLGVVIIAAQLAPPRKGLTRMLEVSSADDGDTVMRGRAALAAVRHVCSSIEGVVAVDARLSGRRNVVVELQVDDRSNVTTIEDDARTRLDAPFWIDLGLADHAINILVTHHRQPPRVR